MAYFEMSFAQRRSKELPKNFDVYIYEEMHMWLRHQPTMHPPHFWDLLNPSDGNFRSPSLGNKEFTTAGEGSREDDALHA
jgi:hypothetical protein